MFNYNRFMLRADTRQKSKTESNIHNDSAFVWFRMSLHKNLSLTDIGPIRQKNCKLMRRKAKHLPTSLI